jgi:Zn-finger nucleic acid-binding protein
MRCPSCSTAMAAEHAGGVVVDICRACLAVWLDAGEPERYVVRLEERT